MELNTKKVNKNKFLNLNNNLIRIVFEYLELIDLFKISNLKKKKLTLIIVKSMEIIFDQRKIQKYDYIEKSFKCGKCKIPIFGMKNEKIDSDHEKHIFGKNKEKNDSDHAKFIFGKNKEKIDSDHVKPNFVKKKEKIDSDQGKYCKNCSNFICENCTQWRDHCSYPTSIRLSQVKIYLAKMEDEEIAKLKNSALIYTKLYKILCNDISKFEIPLSVHNKTKEEIEFTLIKTNHINDITATHQTILKEINLKIVMKIYDDRAIYEDIKAIEKDQIFIFDSFLVEVSKNKIFNIPKDYIKYRNCQICKDGKNKDTNCENCGSNHTFTSGMHWDGERFYTLKCNHCRHSSDCNS